MTRVADALFVALFAVFGLPYVYVVVNLAARGYFAAKLRYHKSVLHTIKEH